MLKSSAWVIVDSCLGHQWRLLLRGPPSLWSEGWSKGLHIRRGNCLRLRGAISLIDRTSLADARPDRATTKSGLLVTLRGLLRTVIHLLLFIVLRHWGIAYSNQVLVLSLSCNWWVSLVVVSDANSCLDSYILNLIVLNWSIWLITFCDEHLLEILCPLHGVSMVVLGSRIHEFFSLIPEVVYILD